MADDDREISVDNPLWKRGKPKPPAAQAAAAVIPVSSAAASGSSAAPVPGPADNDRRQLLPQAPAKGCCAADCCAVLGFAGCCGVTTMVGLGFWFLVLAALHFEICLVVFPISSLEGPGDRGNQTWAKCTEVDSEETVVFEKVTHGDEQPFLGFSRRSAEQRAFSIISGAGILLLALGCFLQAFRWSCCWRCAAAGVIRRRRRAEERKNQLELDDHKLSRFGRTIAWLDDTILDVDAKYVVYLDLAAEAFEVFIQLLVVTRQLANAGFVISAFIHLAVLSLNAIVSIAMLESPRTSCRVTGSRLMDISCDVFYTMFPVAAGLSVLPQMKSMIPPDTFRDTQVLIEYVLEKTWMQSTLYSQDYAGFFANVLTTCLPAALVLRRFGFLFGFKVVAQHHAQCSSGSDKSLGRVVGDSWHARSRPLRRMVGIPVTLLLLAGIMTAAVQLGLQLSESATKCGGACVWRTFSILDAGASPRSCSCIAAAATPKTNSDLLIDNILKDNMDGLLMLRVENATIEVPVGALPETLQHIEIVRVPGLTTPSSVRGTNYVAPIWNLTKLKFLDVQTSGSGESLFIPEDCPLLRAQTLMKLEISNRISSEEQEEEQQQQQQPPRQRAERSTNALFGTLPPSLFNQSQLGWLRIQEQGLSGLLPPAADWNLPDLKSLRLDGVRISGLLPNFSSQQLPKLRQFSVRRTSITGNVPTVYQNWALERREGLCAIDLLCNRNLSGNVSGSDLFWEAETISTQGSECNRYMIGAKGASDAERFKCQNDEGGGSSSSSSSSQPGVSEPPCIHDSSWSNCCTDGDGTNTSTKCSDVSDSSWDPAADPHRVCYWDSVTHRCKYRCHTTSTHHGDCCFWLRGEAYAFYPLCDRRECLWSDVGSGGAGTCRQP